ncbi:MAG: glucokinase [Thermoanaerobaculia bacterium]|nr:glucokinase [Thermoanaerobaculia bacterium]
MILAGDIGGTNVRLALLSDEEGRLELVRVERFAARDYPSLEAVLREFLTSSDSITRVGFGIAGPVHKGRCAATNMPWVVDIHEITRAFGFSRGVLLNDLQANGLGLSEIAPSDFEVLNEGDEDPEGNGAMISPGTGLGQSILIRIAGRFVPQASEGGHSAFAPRDDEEIELLRELLKVHKHVSVERVASGSGFENLYRFYRNRSGEPEPAWLTEEIAAAGDLAPALSRAALLGRDPVCEKALDRFVKIVAAEAANLAVKALSTGGLFIGGGIPPKILPKLVDGNFMDRFCDKGRFSGLLRKMPVKIVLNDSCALFGAARGAADA